MALGLSFWCAGALLWADVTPPALMQWGGMSPLGRLLLSAWVGAFFVGTGLLGLWKWLMHPRSPGAERRELARARLAPPSNTPQPKG